MGLCHPKGHTGRFPRVHPPVPSTLGTSYGQKSAGAEEHPQHPGFPQATAPHLAPVPPSDRSPAAGLAPMTAFLTDPPAVPVPARKPPDHDATPSMSFARDDGEFPSWKDRGTQTEWVYKSKGKGPAPLPPRCALGGGVPSTDLKVGAHALSSC